MSTESTTADAPLINHNPTLLSYYGSLESRIGYRLVLGGTRHFGYWEKDTRWPFPIRRALRKMEKKMHTRLDLPPGSQVIDAGCGVGHVALFMANKGLRVTAFDFTPHHVEKARRNVQRSGLPKGQVTVSRMDYHHLESIPDESHDGVYTMETFVHATDPAAVLAGFYRVTRPGGRIAMFEYDHEYESEEVLGHLARPMHQVNELAAMPMNMVSKKGYFKQLLEEAGFRDVVVEDYSENVRPMLRLFWALAIVPYFFVKLFHLEPYFINTVAGARGLEGQKYWRYVAITATKPGPEVEPPKTK
ncbi:methyltransferase type 11 [Sodiomyces alkalinus F11]|uniref:Methyltransferase type 11 n=1 Tax=Sodiomyces alkalinus (strain CBS 110278 / VKM F-3762 / F11) TaxID=1314773 RepID=A0A3N2Q6X8_SODAK|nr:methyltransferase type 11 [Sodiomyces alkalinus F11]ROT42543.1 methyltransferase type 11 [Sodiomyces alkalinus F11]